MPARRHPRTRSAAERGLIPWPSFDVVSLGEPLYELNRQPDGRFLPGIGGDTLNVAAAAARLGSRTAYATRLGDDIFGAEIRDLMRREGIDESAVIDGGEAPTGIYFVTHGPKGHVFTYRRKGSAASLMTPAGSEARGDHGREVPPRLRHQPGDQRLRRRNRLRRHRHGEGGWRCRFLRHQFPPAPVERESRRGP